MELNGSGSDYGYDDTAIFAEMLALGFLAYSYEPTNRSLTRIGEKSRTVNTLFIRDISRGQELVSAGPKFSVLGKEF
jgi:hypothetical protein